MRCVNRGLLRFEEAIKSEATKKLYKHYLDSFLELEKIKSPDVSYVSFLI